MGETCGPDSSVIQQLLWTDHRMEWSNECLRIRLDSREIFPFLMNLFFNCCLSVPSIEHCAHCEWAHSQWENLTSVPRDSVLVFIRLEQSRMYFPGTCVSASGWRWLLGIRIRLRFLPPWCLKTRKNLCLVPLVEVMKNRSELETVPGSAPGPNKLDRVFPALGIWVPKRRKGVITEREGTRGKKLSHEDPRLCNGWRCFISSPLGNYLPAVIRRQISLGTSLLLLNTRHAPGCSSGPHSPKASVKEVLGGGSWLVSDTNTLPKSVVLPFSWSLI